MKRIILALMLAMVSGFSALAEDTPTVYKIFTSVHSGDCNTLTLRTLNRKDVTSRYFATLVKAGGKIYTDEFFLSSGDQGEGVWDLSSRNDRRMQTAPFPLPKNTPLTVEHTISSVEASPEWRSTATISKCNKNPKVTKVVNHQATPLHANGSFQLFADIGDNAIPNGWEPNTAFLDSDSGVSCAAVEAPVSSCVLQVVPNEAKQQLTQTYTPASPLGGKYIELAAFQLVQGESTVKGNIKATLKFADGSKTTLKLTAKKHSSSEGYKYAVVRTKMPAKLVSAKIVITEKGGTSGVWRIDGLSLSVYKKSKFTPPTPERLPLPAAAS